jgi:hypothetical protein
MQLVCIPPADVHKIWDGTVRDMIDLGFGASDMLMPADILDQLAAGTRLLWVACDYDARIVAAMLTQLFEMRSGLVCKMMECGGSHLSDWVHFRFAIEQYAKREGCSRVLVEGRPGWAGVLKDYRTIGVVLEKRI